MFRRILRGIMKQKKETIKKESVEDFLKRGGKITQLPEELEWDIIPLEEKTRLNVSINNKKNNSGIISFEYRDLNQLDKLINIIKKNY